MESTQNIFEELPRTINMSIKDMHSSDAIISLTGNKLKIIKSRYGPLTSNDNLPLLLQIISIAAIGDINIFKEGLKDDLTTAINEVFGRYNLDSLLGIE